MQRLCAKGHLKSSHKQSHPIYALFVCGIYEYVEHVHMLFVSICEPSIYAHVLFAVLCATNVY